jgi:hypothetical protein
MSGLLGNLLANARKADIADGIHNNCVILSVSNDKRKNNDGVVQDRTGYTKFGKLNDKGVVTAEKEISWWGVKHDTDFAYDNVIEQIIQMTAIAEAVVGLDAVKEAFNDVFEEEEIEGEGKEEVLAALAEAATDKGAVKSLMGGLCDAYVDLLKGKTGPKSSPVRLKLTYDPKGKYIQQPKYGTFVESMEVSAEDTQLKISAKEQEYKLKSTQQITAAPKAAVTNI